MVLSVCGPAKEKQFARCDEDDDDVKMLYMYVCMYVCMFALVGAQLLPYTVKYVELLG